MKPLTAASLTERVSPGRAAQGAHKFKSGSAKQLAASAKANDTGRADKLLRQFPTPADGPEAQDGQLRDASSNSKATGV